MNANQPKTVSLAMRRTSMRLEDEFWAALREIAARENSDVGHMCSMIDAERQGRSLTSTVRVEVMRYFRDRLAALERTQVQPGTRAAPASPPRPVPTLVSSAMR